MTKKEFEKIFLAYFDDVTSFLYMYASSEAQLKDWVQEVFTKLWEKREKIDFDHPSFKSYLLKTSRHHALKQLQREKKYSAWLEKNLVHLTEFQTPFQKTKRNVPATFKTAYKKALTKIPPRALETWKLSREEGLSYPEIAQTMGVSVKTVETQISKALKILREELKNIEN